MKRSPRRWIVLAALLTGAGFVAPIVSAGEEPSAQIVDLPPDTPGEGSIERDALLEFQRDPARNAKVLLRLGAGSVHRLPVVMLLAVGDVHLRAGRYRSARRFFTEVIERDSGEPWTTYAELGLGWTSLARGDGTLASRHYGRVQSPAELAAIANVMSGWSAALRGDTDAAIAILDPAAAGGGPENVRTAALLGAGYARYWAGWYDESESTFDRLAVIAPASPLADDARYAAAWSALRGNHRAQAMAALAMLAGDASAERRDRAFSRAQIELRPDAVIRGGRPDRAEVGGFARPDVRMVEMLDRDGRALARAALALLRRDEMKDDTADEPAPAVALSGVARRSVVEQPLAPRAPAPSAQRASDARRSVGPLFWLAAAIVVVLTTLGWRRRRTSRA